jgi:hypothetical protein
MLSELKHHCSLDGIASDLDPRFFAPLRMTLHRGSQEIVRRYRSGAPNLHSRLEISDAISKRSR